MRPGILPVNLKIVLATASMLCVIVPARPAQQPSKQSKPAPAAPAPAPEPIQIQAIFINPTSKKEGVDPFFPKSERPYLTAHPIKQATQPVSVTADLRLGGISGSQDHRLAIINNKTFEIGEEGDVSSNSDKVRIRCLEIKSESVIIQFVSGGVRRELHLRKGL
jgi:hypothetical protein